VRTGIALLTVGLTAAKRVMALPARPDDELANATGVVALAVRGLRRKPLVVVIVAHQDDIGAGRLERLPDRGHRRCVAVLAGTEPRVVPVGEHAPSRVGPKIRLKPPELSRSRNTTIDEPAVGVD